MKKILYLIIILPVLFIVGCSDNDNDSKPDFEIPDLTANNSVQFKVSHDITAMANKLAQLNVAGEKIAIDWGDGIVEKYSSKETIFIKHTYPSQMGNYVVRIWTEELTDLYIDGGNNAGVYVSSDQISIGNAPKLKRLIIRKCNELNCLDISKCPRLKVFNCEQNKLENLSLENNSRLESLNCQNNNLKTIDVSSNTSLREFNCSFNQIDALDISKNKNLETLYCPVNNLEKLDLSNNKRLSGIYIGSNQFDGAALDNIFTELPAIPKSKSVDPVKKFIIQYAGNKGTGDCDKSILINKGWEILDELITKSKN